MSYYRYITGLYKSDLRALNRTLRSSSVPRHVPDLETGRFSRASSVPPIFQTAAFLRNSATPFSDRARSVPRDVTFSSTRGYSSPTDTSVYRTSGFTDWDRKELDYMNRLDMQHTIRNSVSQARNYSHSATPFNDRARSVTREMTSSSARGYSDLDSKELDYMNRLDMLDSLRNSISQARNYRTAYIDCRRPSVERQYPSDCFASRYNYYDGNKHDRDYMYPVTSDVLGSWKHYHLSSDTLNARNNRARSPLQSRELDRYYETKKYSNYIGDISSGGAVDFRHYNYRRVPYFGASDNYQYMKAKPGRLYSRM